MFVDFIQKRITLFIPFEGDEKKCWDCGGDREIIVRLSLNGDFIGFDECCNLPTEQLVEAFHAD